MRPGHYLLYVQCTRNLKPEGRRFAHCRGCHESNRKAMNRNWSNRKANPALKTKAGNK